MPLSPSLAALPHGAVTERDADEQRWSAWLEQAQAGDASAYEALLNELAPAIRGYLLSRFGPMETLDDCVQECLLAVHQARHTYDVSRPLRPWLFAIVKHRTIDTLRKTRPMPELPQPAVTQHDWNREIDSSRLIAQLSTSLRETLVLTKMLGLSTAECAAQQGISESLVKVRIHRGIRKLKHLWEAEQP